MKYCYNNTTTHIHVSGGPVCVHRLGDNIRSRLPEQPIRRITAKAAQQICRNMARKPI